MKNKKLYLAPECEFQELEPEKSLLAASPLDINYDLPDPDDEKDF